MAELNIKIPEKDARYLLKNIMGFDFCPHKKDLLVEKCIACGGRWGQDLLDACQKVKDKMDGIKTKPKIKAPVEPSEKD